MMKKILIPLLGSTGLFAGPFSPSADTLGSDAIPAASSSIIQWANHGYIVRGKTDITSLTSPLVTYGTIEDALGTADSEENDFFSVVSLGDGGQATMTFHKPIHDIPGNDIAIFENGFSNDFLELAHVEVSSNGTHFFRFPSTSLTQTQTQIGGFGTLDTTNIDQLAGKYRGGFGTPFDLAVLKKLHPTLDTQRITHIRITDVVGSINPAYGTRDSLGNLINEPFKTNFFTGGFDLDAVGSLSVLPDHFEDWLSLQEFSQTAINQTPPGRKVPPMIEYFTGGTDLDIVQVGHIAFDWLSYRPDRSFKIEGSSDLSTWHILASSTQGSSMQNLHPDITLDITGLDKKRVNVYIQASSPLSFFRLTAE